MKNIFLFLCFISALSVSHAASVTGIDAPVPVTVSIKGGGGFSGVLIKNGWVLTAGHALKAAKDDIEIIFQGHVIASVSSPEKNKDFFIKEEADGHEESDFGKDYAGIKQYFKIFGAHDIGLIKIPISEDFENVKTNFLTVSQENDLSKLEDPVVVYIKEDAGDADSLYSPVYFNKSGLKYTEEGILLTFENLDAVKHGDSGAPLFAGNKLIGIVRGGVDILTKEGQTFEAPSFVPLSGGNMSFIKSLIDKN